MNTETQLAEGIPCIRG